VTVDLSHRSSWPAPAASRRRRLRVFNLAVGLALASEGVLMLVLSNSLALPITASYLTSDPVAARGPTTPERLFSLPIGPTVAVFLLLAAVDHLVVASPGAQQWYARSMDRRSNYARWIEYSISASIMIVLIGLFVGIRDLAAVVALFAVNTAMILFGLLMERQQRPGSADWSAFWFGSLVGAVPWILVGVYLAGAPGAPGFVYAITATQFVLFFSFAANMALQYEGVGRWRDYTFGEVGYIVLSLAAKSLLAWLIFANVLRT
jgi:bacteriorhodopsin